MRKKNVFVFVVRVRGEGKERVRVREACSKDKRRVRGESIVFVRRGEGKERVRVRDSWDVFVFGEG